MAERLMRGAGWLWVVAACVLVASPCLAGEDGKAVAKRGAEAFKKNDFYNAAVLFEKAAQLDAALAHQAFALHGVALRGLADRAQLRLVLVAQRQVQDEIEVVANAELRELGFQRGGLATALR